jgi:hypothetical protein
MPEPQAVLVFEVPKPDQVVISWLDEVETFIHTEAYSVN